MNKLIILFVALCLSLMSYAGCVSDDSDIASGFRLNIVAEKGGTIPTDLNGRYPVSTLIEVVATPDPGYSFYRWTVYQNGVEIHSCDNVSNQYRLFMPDCDVKMVATFGKTSELFSVAYASGEGGGFAGGMDMCYTGTYYVGDLVPTSIMMRVHLGYTFDKTIVYSNDGEVLWTQYHDEGGPPFVMPACDVTIMVMFKEI